MILSENIMKCKSLRKIVILSTRSEEVCLLDNCQSYFLGDACSYTIIDSPCLAIDLKKPTITVWYIDMTFVFSVLILVNLILLFTYLG